MHDLGRHRRAVDGRRRRAGFARHHRRGAGRRDQGLHLPADQRQPHGLRQARQPQRQGHARRGDRPGQGAAGQARLHDPHRRHHASVEGSEFDDAEKIIAQAKLDVHYVPGEHDIIDEQPGKLYRERYGRGAKGAGWYSFDANGVHFIGLVNVVDLKAGGLGNLGDEQLEWLEDDVKGRSASTPIVVFAHIPLWTVYPNWGWGTEDGARALGYLKTLRLGHRAQRPHPPGDAEGRGQRHLPHRALDRVPAAGAGHGALARADEGARTTSCAACSASPASPSSRTSSGSPSSTRRCKANTNARSSSHDSNADARRIRRDARFLPPATAARGRVPRLTSTTSPSVRRS